MTARAFSVLGDIDRGFLHTRERFSFSISTPLSFSKPLWLLVFYFFLQLSQLKLSLPVACLQGWLLCWLSGKHHLSPSPSWNHCSCCLSKQYPFSLCRWERFTGKWRRVAQMVNKASLLRTGLGFERANGCSLETDRFVQMINKAVIRSPLISYRKPFLLSIWVCQCVSDCLAPNGWCVCQCVIVLFLSADMCVKVSDCLSLGWLDDSLAEWCLSACF